MPDHPTASSASSEATGAASAHAGHHGFDFALLNQSHNWGYPAVEWVHGAPPQLILNLADYAARNQLNLAAAPGYAAAAPDAGTLRWAEDYAADHGGDAAALAKAMVVADSQAWATMPRALSFLNHQTFWSSIALLLLAATLLVFARRRPDQHRPANRVQTAIEMVVLFVRDDIVRANLPHGDGWTPFITALFLAILGCNLFGLVPLFGTATSSILVTGAFALPIFLLMLGLGFWHNGPGFLLKVVPVHWSWKPMDMFVWLLLLGIELFSLVVKPSVLAIRLFANMLAGHTVLLVFASLGFIVASSSPDTPAMYGGLGAVSWIIAVAFYGLELLVAFIQAYIFALLATVFIGSCIHPEH